MLEVNKKVLWISDFDLDTAPGGAQRSDFLIIEKAKLLGISIKKTNKDNILDIENFNAFDMIVTSNVTVILNENPHLLDNISSHKNHVRLEHDSNEHISPEQREKLFSNCSKTIFLSEYQHSFFKGLYGDIFKNVEIIYDPINSKKFKDESLEREDKILFAGYMHELKGVDHFFEYALDNPDKDFVIAGFTSSKIYHILAQKIKNIEYLGKVNHDKMPEIFNKYKAMFYSPLVREPFCRSVAEAVLCGMDILTDRQDKIGSLQEIKKVGIEEFRDKCNNAAKTFWEKI
jgi:glycosyltransferase involved in cell wall biosynthesis